MPTPVPLTYAPIQTINATFASIVVKRRFVSLSMTAAEYCGAGAKCLGVSPDDYDIAAAETGAVITKGIAFVEASAAISVGAAIKSTSTGKAVTAVTLTATVPGSGTDVTSSSAQPAMTIAGSVLPEVILGYALDAASADGDFIRVMLL